ncbi:LacI family DNA-binding transcriptional regulator [Streptomyces sp. MST-110588]|uniref:LacI family DNA-binding transcriptional regulator n=1 Tax=Streptomyces sp. MST-110588 TaxID=2833628 RepID=UPI001F5DB991|nr:LacI family DNA-binding transcriptional regulator [Streptomyces sp. MST-110588]UNO42695.1 LacI family DNA-binding transcriptional regulator [Streptomyces sp. MST-110588]
MTTMADVARHAGVSVATVSHVLNETRTVRPGTRAAVLDAIDELGYTHNTLARSLVTSRTRSIGLAVSAISNPYFTEILQGVESSALEAGYSLLIADPHDDPEHELKVVRLLHERRVDGMIVAPSAAPAGMVQYVTRRAVPTVFLDRLVGEEHDQVCAENTAPVRELVEHLAGLGHTRIGLVAGLPGLSTTTERVQGYREGLRARGLPFVPELLAGGNSEARGAEAATRHLLAASRPPTAIITANNAMTIGTLQALRDLGREVPHDIALACFDDFSWADLFSPRLTAVCQPSKEIGATAVRLLLERLEEPGRPPRTLRLPCTFVHRTSCGCREDGTGPGGGSRTGPGGQEHTASRGGDSTAPGSRAQERNRTP